MFIQNQEIKPPSVILSLFSRCTHQSKKESPKNYPLSYSKELVKLFKKSGIQTIQIGVSNEPDIDADIRINKLSPKDLIELIKNTTSFICVDNFLNHFAHFYGCKGIVIWSQSNPKVFGYKENINLLKGEKYLRPTKQQFEFWEDVPYILESFVTPALVMAKYKEHFLNNVAKKL